VTDLDLWLLTSLRRLPADPAQTDLFPPPDLPGARDAGRPGCDPAADPKAPAAPCGEQGDMGAHRIASGTACPSDAQRDGREAVPMTTEAP
jgi:hypothetical protein